MVEALDPQVLKEVLYYLPYEVDKENWVTFYRHVWLQQALADDPALLAEIEEISDNLLLSMRFQEAVLMFGPDANRLEYLSDPLFTQLTDDVFLLEDFLATYPGEKDHEMWHFENLRVYDPYIRAGLAALESVESEQVLPHFTRLLQLRSQVAAGTQTRFTWACMWFAFCILQTRNMRSIELIGGLNASLAEQARCERMRELKAAHDAFLKRVDL